MATLRYIALPLIALGLLGGCRQISVSHDFSSPYEQDGVLLPRATTSYRLAGPPGLSVDIGLDFEESERRSDRLQLTVQAGGEQRRGTAVPGSQLRRAVCAVTLVSGGITVDVTNLNTYRSAPYALRVERSPSPICKPRRHVPSSTVALR